MKKILTLLALLGLFVAISSSCSKKSSANPDAPAPTVKLVLGGNSILTGQDIIISFTASSSVNMKSIHLEDILSGASVGAVIKDSAINTMQMAYILVFKTGTPGARTIKVTITDVNNKSTSDIQPLVVSGSSMQTYVSANANPGNSLPKNAQLELDINSQSAEYLKHIKITQIVPQKTDVVVCDSNIFTFNLNLTYFIKAPKDYTGAATYKVEVTDIRNYIASTTVNVSYINKMAYAYLSLGAESQTSEGNFLSTPTFIKYFKNTGASNSAKIDIGYYVDPSNGPIIGSPYYLKNVYGLTWPTLNRTQFIVQSIAGGIDQNRDPADIKAIFDSGTPSDGVQVSGNGFDHVFFKTVDGRYGEMVINSAPNLATETTVFGILSQ